MDVREATFEHASRRRMVARDSIPFRLLVGVATLAALVGGLVGGLVVAVLSHSSHFTYASPADLNVRAAQSFNVNAEHVRLVGRDGNFELEHSASTPTSVLNAYVLGSTRRTPIQIGGADMQDVLPLLVDGLATQRQDLQEWKVGSTVTAAVDGRGRLRLSQVTLATTVRSGIPYLVARLPTGHVYLLPLGSRAK